MSLDALARGIRRRSAVALDLGMFADLPTVVRHQTGIYGDFTIRERLVVMTRVLHGRPVFRLASHREAEQGGPDVQMVLTLDLWPGSL